MGSEVNKTNKEDIGFKYNNGIIFSTVSGFNAFLELAAF